MPLPNTRVIPPGWSEHHRPVAEGRMTGTCQIVRDTGPGGWDPTTGPEPPDPDTVIYDGPCFVQQLERTRSGDAAGELVTETDYLVGIEHDAPELRAGDTGDVVRLTDCPDDPQLVDRPLRIVNIGFGTALWQRDLICQDDLAANNPPIT